ncbi:hypothetical protein PHYSODRAFT_558166 [Phytophthora sojae]|uniref:Uncharacterized protein n=1 Tax=Phytophthora sojae (strain P6497) TaxID=1094619 RepID=G4Z4C7_PHYSP|nr:hypothetical protein PHYSODRAFT_558166 [Phytophthora sojae]EGZ19433.1 hypothetical protein PHYSODRAFT_558166 [Phytophthora sojae]|eukprot:XP_009522150.1 hypothetical protein PHYSODRAFT_558166 [Phytophthora sojae]
MWSTVPSRRTRSQWAIQRGFGVRSITFPDCAEAEWQGRAQILVANIGGIAAYRAARFGDLDFIKWLASKYREIIDVQYWVHTAENAREGGHLSVVQWVFMNVGGVVRGNGPAVAMFAAAENGKVDVVEWLHKQYGGKMNIELFEELHVPSDDEDAGMVPTTAMDAAARNGHLCVLKYLNGIDAVARNKQKKRAGKSKRTQNRHTGHFPRCTSFAMDAAAGCGHLNVVKWLHAHRSEGCTTTAMDRAAGNGHLDVVQWLHSHRSEGCTTAAMANAATRPFHALEIIQWLHLNRTEGCTTAAMDGAAANGNFTLLQWLHDNTAVGCSSRSMVSAARLGRLDILKWLTKYYAEAWTHKAMSKAASRGHLNVVKWLCENRGEGFAGKAMEKAASRGHLHVVRWLLPHCTNPDGFLSAMKLAHSGEHFEVMLLLDAQLGTYYDDGILREMRGHWLKYHDIQRWFDEKYPPSSG